jgi:hypothetical protein
MLSDMVMITLKKLTYKQHIPYFAYPEAMFYQTNFKRRNGDAVAHHTGAGVLSRYGHRKIRVPLI